MPEDRAQAFLQMIRRSQRGRLKVYLGFGPGVGKTYQMLLEAHRLKREGIDIVVGLVETHGRAETAKLIEGLEVVPRRRIEYRNIIIEEMDVDAILRRAPKVVIVDELAHTNAPGSKNPKRYQDVQDILAAGIHVISALNIQHLESLYNTVEQLVGVKVRERIPDSVLAEADQIINVDLTAEDLQQRLKDGKIYPRDRVQSSLDNFFTSSNLEHLRELALRELASQLDFKRRETTSEPAAGGSNAPDQIMVCLSSRGPNSARLLRFASRLAGRLNRNWYAVYVQTPAEEPTVIDAQTQRLLADTLTLANQLGATVFTFKGQDIPDTILRFAEEYRVGQVVIGKPRPVSWWKRITGEKSVAEELLHRAKGVTIVVVDAESEERAATNGAAIASPLNGLLTASRVVICEDAITRQDIRERLVQCIIHANPTLDRKHVLQKLHERESQGSTFLNEGVALPHARLDEVTEPQVALGITHGGVLDAQTTTPIEAVFLMLSPANGAGKHLQLLARVGRTLQNRELRRSLLSSKTPDDVIAAIRDFEVGA
ncbi:MAG: PTS sugar transporter subunit IIA [Phycisphaerae bacterium]|nr:PTS sugar transporter subunit IIA [Phycisphaerae bacterium]